MNRLGALIAVILILMALPLSPGRVTAQAPDYDIPGGHFYTQANGQGGTGGSGYSITDEGGIPFWTQYKSIGGVSGVGYVSSRRFQYKGFISQATQKYVLQWQTGGLYYLNVFDELSALGRDDWLLTVRSIPKPAILDEVGKPLDQITAERLALLDANPAIKAVYMASADPIRTHGFPTSRVQDIGPAYVIRNQRDVIQQWKVDMPWAKAGEVTIVNGGDIAKEAGLVPAETASPEVVPGAPPPAVPVPTSLPLPAASPFQYNLQGITWEPNCGLVQIKVYVRDDKGAFINNVRVVVASTGAWSAISVPTGQEGRDPGWTNVVLRTDPVDEPWYVWVIDDAGNQVSESINVITDQKSCEPTGTGHQVATVVFVKGVPAPVAVTTPLPATTTAPVTAPAPAAAPSLPFANAGITWEPNCGMTQIKVKVLDQNAKALDGILLHIESEDATWMATSRKTGSEGYDTGWTEFFLRAEPVGGAWKVWAIDGYGNRLSDTVWLATDTGPCEPGREGHQVALIQFQQLAPIVTPTPLYPYSYKSISWAPSCTLTQLNILVKDRNGNPVDGVGFRVETDGVEWRSDSVPTGSTNQGPGWTNFWLRGEPFALHLNLFARNNEGGPTSEIMTVDTTNTDCSTAGHQIATIEFVKN